MKLSKVHRFLGNVCDFLNNKKSSSLNKVLNTMYVYTYVVKLSKNVFFSGCNTKN